MPIRLKPGIKTIQRDPLIFQLDEHNRPVRYQPWLGDAFALLYDFFMTRSVFPRKLNADISRHYSILSAVLADVQNQVVLELGTGSGCTVDFLPPDNTYIGSDISTGLLKMAAQRFKQAGFQNTAFYVASGDDLPFAGESFDLCLCILSLNFIGHHRRVFEGVHGFLRPGGRFICCTPVPERNKVKSTIRGELLSEVRLQKLCRETGFAYERIDQENGVLLYFQASPFKI